MKVLQLIDSLEAGGAERMAVNIANKLVGQVDASHLCATRKEGLLKAELSSAVVYFFLNKKSAYDLISIRNFISYIKSSEIDIIHAHSTSFFLATLAKIYNPHLKIIWHDHYGKSDDLIDRPKVFLKLSSHFFYAIISVNKSLADWASEYLHCKSVYFLRNFIYQSATNTTEIKLEGSDGLRLVCVANFRRQKDHINLLEAFKLLQAEFPAYTLHMFGQINNDDYSEEIIKFIEDEKIRNTFIHGSVQNVSKYLEKCDIGILSSRSEGLPLALLEYGLAGLPVVCTNVGQCNEVVDSDGILVQPNNPLQLFNGIKHYILNPIQRQSDAQRFKEKIINDYSAETFIPALLKIYG